MKHEFVYAAIGKVAGAYDAGLSVSGYRSSVRRFLSEFRKIAGGDLRSILDAGCGTGVYTLSLLSLFPEAHIVAFDREPTMVERVKENLERAKLSKRVTLFVADISGALPKEVENVDALVISGVLEYVPPEQTIRALAAFLRPGGIVLHSPVRDTPYGRSIGKLYNFTPRAEERYLKAFASAGFNHLKTIRLPALHPASFKEAQVFRKL